ncbi:aspartate aminotransferase family protein [Prochlorococcus marinus]|uniref:Acetylornithine aminotransferase n=1 Tax=Prochlorococcus marinus XMU1408 TaxID=2213228 RepID=A0A318RD14_PROMR|nr:aspartate aminotransferase family protein [Prochlorococcus marinus]MBW3042481.1 aspartate aminotransferase family protein [Prochlorococcus marinus str. XMU1408]PYE01212.1 aspartate aminotransferase family protein [Prochlorococcus marinus XMU1408]
MKTYQRFPLDLVKGKGCWVWDEKGEKYLDAVAGIATCSLGHSNRALIKSLSKQLRKLQHVSNLYQIPEQEELAQWLTSNSFAKSAFFCNSGAEANEAAIKLARKYGHIKRNIDNPIILCSKESFHGRTLAAVSATGQPKYHNGFEPMVDGFKFFSYNDNESFKNLFDGLEKTGPKIAAVLIEPIQGEGGINVGEKSFFQLIKAKCTENNVLLMFDEVQTGMGRTGTLWGYEQLGIEPDVFTLAKGLGGGHAIGALLVNQLADVFQPGDHASTFGGNPFACRAALTVGREIQKRKLLIKITERGIQLKEGLINLSLKYSDIFFSTRGIGLIQGLVLKDNKKITSLDIVKSALEEKLLLVSAGAKVLRIVPPLIITKKEINELLSRLDKCLMKLS